MSRLTIRNLGIAAAFLLVSSAVFIYGIFIIDSQNQLLDEQITALEKNQAQEAIYRQMQRVSEESRDDRILLQSRFLESEGESIDFLNTVESLARDVGIELKTEELKKSGKKDDDSERLTIRFSYSGEYNSVTSFLKTLENLPYVAKITSFELSSLGEDKGWRAIVTMQVNLHNYEN